MPDSISIQNVVVEGNPEIAPDTSGGGTDTAYTTDDSASTTINDTDYVPLSDTNGNRKKSLWSNIVDKIKTAIWKPNTNAQDGYVTSGAGQINKIWKTDASGNPAWRVYDNLPFEIVTALDADTVSTDGLWYARCNIANAPSTKYGVFWNVKSMGTPFQMYFPDDTLTIYKRWYTNGAWTAWQEVDTDTQYPKAVRNITRSGTTFTATCYDGTTFTFTQQDNDTKYPVYNTSGMDSNFTTKFRTEVTGDSNSKPFLAAIRNNNAGVTAFPQYASGVAFGVNDTQGFIIPGWSASDKSCYVGGGNGDAINWTANLMKGVKEITRSGTTFTVTRLDGTTFTFDQQDTNTWRPVENNLVSTSTTSSLSAYMGRHLDEMKQNKLWEEYGILKTTNTYIPYDKESSESILVISPDQGGWYWPFTHHLPTAYLNQFTTSGTGRQFWANYGSNYVSMQIHVDTTNGRLYLDAVSKSISTWNPSIRLYQR